MSRAYNKRQSCSIQKWVCRFFFKFDVSYNIILISFSFSKLCITLYTYFNIIWNIFIRISKFGSKQSNHGRIWRKCFKILVYTSFEFEFKLIWYNLLIQVTFIENIYIHMYIIINYVIRVKYYGSVFRKLKM